jgi:hypothetical protein
LAHIRIVRERPSGCCRYLGARSAGAHSSHPPALRPCALVEAALHFPPIRVAGSARLWPLSVLTFGKMTRTAAQHCRSASQQLDGAPLQRCAICASCPCRRCAPPSAPPGLTRPFKTQPPQTRPWTPISSRAHVARPCAAPQARSMSSAAAHSGSAESAGGGSGVGTLFPMHKKGDNLFDLLGMLDYYGVGYKAARQDWVAR